MSRAAHPQESCPLNSHKFPILIFQGQGGPNRDCNARYHQTSHYLTPIPILHGQAGLMEIPTPNITLPHTNSHTGRTEDSHAIHHATPHRLTVLILHGQRITTLDNNTSTHTNSHTPWAKNPHVRQHVSSHQLSHSMGTLGVRGFQRQTSHYLTITPTHRPDTPCAKNHANSHIPWASRAYGGITTLDITLTHTSSPFLYSMGRESPC